MQLICQHQPKAVEKLAADPAVIELLSYLVECREELILRQLRTKFNHIKNFDRLIDELVAQKIIIRENRRYRLGIQLINASSAPELTVELEGWLRGILEETDQAELLTIGELLWPLLEQPTVLYLREEALPVRTAISSADWELVTLNAQEIEAVTLPNYFYLKKAAATPTAFGIVQKLIGDVDEGFFMDQVGVIFEQLAKQKLRTRRPSIFREALTLTKVIDSERQTLEVPCFLERETDKSLVSEQKIGEHTPAVFHDALARAFSNILNEKIMNEITYIITKAID